jgi:hypothetical protein
MTSGPLLALAALMLPQAPVAGSFAFERRKAALIEEIEAAAVAETPVYGIDTEVNAARILKSKDAELDPRRTMSLAQNILRDSFKMSSSSSRLILQAEMARWFHEQGERLKAGEAAQALQASFEALVQCKDQRCEVFETDADNSPGELIMTFAEYLKKNGISPAELGLNHPGLRALAVAGTPVAS